MTGAEHVRGSLWAATILQEEEFVTQVQVWLPVQALSNQECQLVGVLAWGRHADSALQAQKKKDNHQGLKHKAYAMEEVRGD